MKIQIEGYVPDCEEEEEDSATLLVIPDDYAEYGRVDIRMVAVGCDKTIRCSLEELYAALCSAMAMRRQAQVTKANKNRGWLPAPIPTSPYWPGRDRWE